MNRSTDVLNGLNIMKFEWCLWKSAEVVDGQKSIQNINNKDINTRIWVCIAESEHTTNTSEYLHMPYNLPLCAYNNLVGARDTFISLLNYWSSCCFLALRSRLHILPSKQAVIKWLLSISTIWQLKVRGNVMQHNYNLAQSAYQWIQVYRYR